LFYTSLPSLPLLVGILFVYNSLGSLCLFLFYGNNFLIGGLLYVCKVFSFFVRLPMYMVHMLLPMAHIEAPVSGSIILVGVLLKLGGCILSIYTNIYCIYIYIVCIYIVCIYIYIYVSQNSGF
jgi:NADH-ubiquinone oxidoreductase chain 4